MVRPSEDYPSGKRRQSRVDVRPGSGPTRTIGAPHTPGRYGGPGRTTRTLHPVTPSMPATLPPPTPTPAPDGSADYFAEPAQPHAYPQQPDSGASQGPQQGQVKRCCQCLSPLSADSNMTFHIELAPSAGPPRQEQICARCVIRGGILAAEPAIDDDMAVLDGAHPDGDHDNTLESDDPMRCAIDMAGEFDPESVVRGLARSDSDQMLDDGIQRDHDRRSFTPPRSPTSASPSLCGSFDLARHLTLGEASGSGSGSSSTVAPSPPPIPRPSSSVPSNFDFYPGACASASTSASGSLRHSPVPRTPSPEQVHAHEHDRAPRAGAGPGAISAIAEEHEREQAQDKPRQVVLPDLYNDITFVRRKTDGRGCLYPGSVFSGTQRSGRNSYDVTVTIVDVSFAEATLTGYLLIHNLTSSHPRLTTLFTADIIGGPAHGFHTGAWGATEDDDMTHWSRFRGFAPLKKELRGPRANVDSRERSCVFMRWKERFLVPDHRVRDINGASFAGFYYVCVDFDPSAPLDPSSLSSAVSSSNSSHPLTSARLPPTPRNSTTPAPPAAAGTRSRAATLMGDVKSFDWQTHEREKVELLERARGKGYGTAMMEGLYFHQNSEPYQHLSLRHMPERTSSAFELR